MVVYTYGLKYAFCGRSWAGQMLVVGCDSFWYVEQRKGAAASYEISSFSPLFGLHV